MKKLPAITSTIAAVMSLGLVIGSQAQTPAAAPAEPLLDTIVALDTAVFDAFNHCDAPGQIEKHESYFAPDVEFYHDTGGVTWTREAMLANTRKNVCGHFRRQRLPGSLRVYPVKDFGAIEMGAHEFCQIGADHCEGLADFTIVWRLKDGAWKITRRVLSYGHRGNE